MESGGFDRNEAYQTPDLSPRKGSEEDFHSLILRNRVDLGESDTFGRFNGG